MGEPVTTGHRDGLQVLTEEQQEEGWSRCPGTLLPAPL